MPYHVCLVFSAVTLTALWIEKSDSLLCGKLRKMLVFLLRGLVNVLLQVDSPDGYIFGGVGRGCGLSSLCIFHGVFSAIITRGSFLVVTDGALHVFTPSEGPRRPRNNCTQMLSPPPWKLILSYSCHCRNRRGAALGRWLRTSRRGPKFEFQEHM